MSQQPVPQPVEPAQDVRADEVVLSDDCEAVETFEYYPKPVNQERNSREWVWQKG